jgi:hypothetical protein
MHRDAQVRLAKATERDHRGRADEARRDLAGQLRRWVSCDQGSASGHISCTVDTGSRSTSATRGTEWLAPTFDAPGGTVETDFLGQDWGVGASATAGCPGLDPLPSRRSR